MTARRVFAGQGGNRCAALQSSDDIVALVTCESAWPAEGFSLRFGARQAHLGSLDEQIASVWASETPDDPWAQLFSAIEAVFKSWNSPRARAYREHENVPDAPGTAVNVQPMVFGNLDERPGTGVAFTRNPSTGEAVLCGDFLFRAQCDDV